MKPKPKSESDLWSCRIITPADFPTATNWKKKRKGSWQLESKYLGGGWITPRTLAKYLLLCPPFQQKRNNYLTEMWPMIRMPTQHGLKNKQNQSKKGIKSRKNCWFLWNIVKGRVDFLDIHFMDVSPRRTKHNNWYQCHIPDLWTWL